MIEIARLPADERQELFHNTAAKTGLHDAIAEKDFWVCLTLDYLFHRCPWTRRRTRSAKGLVLCQEKVQIKHAFFKVGLPCQSFCFFV